MRVLVTGSSGLVGRAVTSLLTAEGVDVVQYDAARCSSEDIRNPTAVRNAASDVDGIIHLAAVSRVVWAQNNPELCQAVNQVGVRNILTAMAERRQPPWLLFASSREVYGQQDILPVSDNAALRPMNIYARSKVLAEEAIARMASGGFVANSVRLSNVYGCPLDHIDRVVPAFARVAALGGALRLEGSTNSFDFTHINDVAAGIVKLASLSANGTTHRPIHLTTGRQTTLARLASIVRATTQHSVTMQDAPPRDYDVSNFCGCTERTQRLLGWSPSISIEDGFSDLVSQYQELAA